MSKADEIEEMIKSTENSINETCKLLQDIPFINKKSADEMFEKLGYTITEEVISSERYIDGIQFMKQEGIYLKKYIEFYYYHKQICIYAEQDIDGTIKRWESVIIDAKEIQAIN